MIDIAAIDPVGICQGFILGAISVGGAVYAKWELIPAKKRAAALAKLKQSFDDGEITVEEFVSAAAELI